MRTHIDGRSHTSQVKKKLNIFKALNFNYSSLSKVMEYIVINNIDYCLVETQSV